MKINISHRKHATWHVADGRLHVQGASPDGVHWALHHGRWRDDGATVMGKTDGGCHAGFGIFPSVGASRRKLDSVAVRGWGNVDNGHLPQAVDDKNRTRRRVIPAKPIFIGCIYKVCECMTTYGCVAVDRTPCTGCFLQKFGQRYPVKCLFWSYRDPKIKKKNQSYR